MTNETRELLYNKTANQITQKERDYLNDIGMREYNLFNAKTYFGLPILAMLFANLLLPFIIPPFSPIIAIGTGAIGLLIGVTFGGLALSYAPSLKRLGLTRKEWKELRKSKRIKKINEIVNEFDYNRRLEMAKANNRLDEIISKQSYRPINLEQNVENNEQVDDKVSLILKMAEELSHEEKSSLITRLINKKESNLESTIISTDGVEEESHRENDYLKSDNLPYDELDDGLVADIEAVISNIRDIINNQ